tara:strand:+ start:969 stop:1202 length:234 start_codon:yes stop_codon:yes gene_type:complete
MGGFIRKIFKIEQPTFEQPIVEEVPAVEDEERELEQRRILEEQEKKRKGRRSTILTGPQGLTTIDEEEIDKKTLLGD